jgi:hypothetical protein
MAISMPCVALEVHGSVYNNSGEIVRFAAISIYKNPDYTDCLSSSWTDMNGVFSISIESLPENKTIYVVAEKDGEFGKNGNKAGEDFNITINPNNKILVPEFPLMALPIAVMIALVFLFITSKKHN